MMLPFTLAMSILHFVPTFYLITERLKEAEALFLESIELIPDQASTYNNLGMACTELDRAQAHYILLLIILPC